MYNNHMKIVKRCLNGPRPIKISPFSTSHITMLQLRQRILENIFLLTYMCSLIVENLRKIYRSEHAQK